MLLRAKTTAAQKVPCLLVNVALKASMIIPADKLEQQGFRTEIRKSHVIQLLVTYIFIPAYCYRKVIPASNSRLFPMEPLVISPVLLLQNSLTVNRGTEKNVYVFTIGRWECWSCFDLHVGLHLALTFPGLNQNWLEDIPWRTGPMESELPQY